MLPVPHLDRLPGRADRHRVPRRVPELPDPELPDPELLVPRRVPVHRDRAHRDLRRAPGLPGPERRVLPPVPEPSDPEPPDPELPVPVALVLIPDGRCPSEVVSFDLER